MQCRADFMTLFEEVLDYSQQTSLIDMIYERLAQRRVIPSTGPSNMVSLFSELTRVAFHNRIRGLKFPSSAVAPILFAVAVELNDSAWQEIYL
jgi:hypothetical protein